MHFTSWKPAHRESERLEPSSGTLARAATASTSNFLPPSPQENAVTPVAPSGCPLLEQTKIDIRRDGLTTLNSFIAAIQERSDSQATVVAKLLQRVEPNGSITTVAFESMSAGELIGLIEAEPKGLHIDPVVSGTTAEGEDAATLTADGILAKIREAVGDSGMANYRVEAEVNGGFIVHSRTAQERPFDVNGDGRASPVDTLIIINSLSAGGTQQLALWPPLSELRSDINLDGFRSPIDALLIINFLNAAALTPAAEGEGFAKHLAPPPFNPWQPAAERAIALDMSLNLGVKSTATASEKTVVPIWHRWVDTNVAQTTEPATAQIEEFSLLDELDEILDDVVNGRAVKQNALGCSDLAI